LLSIAVSIRQDIAISISRLVTMDNVITLLLLVCDYKSSATVF
jgi:hypothetical protein